MSKIHNLISRKNIYAVAGLVVIIFIFIYVFFPKNREATYSLIFNPFWPVALGIFEIYLQNKEKETAKENEQKISALSGVLRGRLDKKEEHELIKSIMDAMREKDLMNFNANKIEQMELAEEVEKAGIIKGNSKGVSPD